MNLEEKNKADMLNLLRFVAFMCIFLLHTKLFLLMSWNEALPLPWLTYTPAWGGCLDLLYPFRLWDWFRLFSE